MGAWKTILVHDFNLRRTLESGQFFRYAQENDYYVIVTQGKVFRVKQEPSRLLYDGVDPAFVKQFFQLNASFTEQIARLQKDPVLRPLIKKYSGLRILRQDLHETILAFICSSQSNIPKIRMNMRLLAERCGIEICDKDINGQYDLPEPGTSLDPAVVFSAKTGFRAKYLVATNIMLTNQVLSEIIIAEYEKSHELLCMLSGVGPKIADCVCLFALGHGKAFPVDVHIARAMQELFPKTRSYDEKKIKHFAQQRWEDDAGLAQQFIYEWQRRKNESVQDAEDGKERTKEYIVRE